MMRQFLALLVGCGLLSDGAVSAQQSKPLAPSTLRAPSRAEMVKGDYGRYRANNDLLHYDLDIKVDPDKKWLSGRNTIRFKMLKDDTRIQLDLVPYMKVERILFASSAPLKGAPYDKATATELKYERDLTAVYIDFPSTLRAGRTYEIEFHYSGNPVETGRFDGFAFKKDADGNNWINTANEGEGASLWWPCKDQWRDEPEGMEIKIAVPNDLTNVSNGRFIAKTDLGDGFTKWHYRVHYPINAYNVSVNAARYVHFGEKMGDLTLDYYVLPGSLEKAKTQFAQAKPMIEAFEKYFGEYPFKKDGFKLIEVPYSGMEHQSAVTYGNRFANGYLERDWTGVGVSLKFDFIIIHESAHEWFGNAVSAADQADMWIHEAWATYLECLYVEHMFGYDDALKYTNGYRSKIANAEPIVIQRGIYRSPNQDQYFKGALFLHTLRSVVNDDTKWWKLLRDLYAEFKYRNVLTEDLVAFVNKQLGQDLTPVFDQYLRRAALPVLEVTYNDADKTIAYRWNAAERGFAMPLKVDVAGKPIVITPTTAQWQTLPGGADELKVPLDRYYIEVATLDARGRPIKP
jgi:aminopeptidase N